MSNVNPSLALVLIDNPFVSFNSDGDGVSRVFDIVWDFTAQAEHLKKIGFSSFPDAHRTNVQSYLYALISYNKKIDISGHISVSRMIYWRDCMMYLVKSWGKSEFHLLARDDEWLEAKASLDGKYSVKTLESIASLINKMQEARLVERNIERSQLHTLANEKSQQQHIALPTAIHAQILEKIIDTIELYHPHRHAISDMMQQAMEFRREYHDIELERLGIDDMNEIEDRRFRKRFNRRLNIAMPNSIPGFEFSPTGDWVRSIADDCLIAVGLFSGARREELLAMNPDSYDVVNGVSVLRGSTTKGNEAVALATTWVSHPLAEKALELAYDMTEYARIVHRESLNEALSNKLISQDKYNSNKKELASSFISVDLRKMDGKAVNSTYITTIKGGFDVNHFNISATHDDVEEFNILNPSWHDELKLNGTLPKLNLHCLRRSFAVFLVRNRLCDLQTVKYQFKHKNLNMSAWYANYAELMRMTDILLDRELFDMVENAMEQVAVDAFDEIYNESETLSGGASERIMREKNDALQRGERIVMSREEITKLVRKKSLSIVLLPTGSYCTNPDCERLCSIESFVVEDKRCEHEVLTKKRAKIMGNQRDRLISTFRAINDMNDFVYTRILAAHKQKILVMESDLKKHFIKFEPFSDEIKGLIV